MEKPLELYSPLHLSFSFMLCYGKNPLFTFGVHRKTLKQKNLILIHDFFPSPFSLVVSFHHRGRVLLNGYAISSVFLGTIERNLTKKLENRDILVEKGLYGKYFVQNI
jgi:hypothetical protein